MHDVRKIVYSLAVIIGLLIAILRLLRRTSLWGVTERLTLTRQGAH
jgi:hypothetical protein